MGIASGIAAAVGTAVSVGTTIAAQERQEEAQEEREQAAARKRAQAEVENARKRRRAVAQQRIQQGQIANNAALSNTQGSSGVLGGAGALASDFGSGLASFDNAIASNQAINDNLSAASSLQADASRISTYGQLASSTLGGASELGSSIADGDFSGLFGNSGSSTGGSSANTNNSQTFGAPGQAQAGPTFRKLG